MNRKMTGQGVPIGGPNPRPLPRRGRGAFWHTETVGPKQPQVKNLRLSAGPSRRREPILFHPAYFFDSHGLINNCALKGTPCPTAEGAGAFPAVKGPAESAGALPAVVRSDRQHAPTLPRAIALLL